MQVAIEDAHRLARAALASAGYSNEEAGIIADHMIGCELRGVANGGISRTISVVERVRSEGGHKRRMKIVRTTPVSALIDGGGDVGYLVGQKTAELAIAKAEETGIGIVGCYNSWYTGMFVHYMEMATDKGLVAMAAGSSAWRVAPFGSNEGRFGTNPIAFGFPANGDPIIADIGTSAVMVSDATLDARLGLRLPDQVAFDASGAPTTDPLEALKGCFAVWGGHKGSALAICVQLFGLLSGSPVEPDPKNDCSMYMMVMQPDILVPTEQLKHSVSAYAEAVRSARTWETDAAIRMPFDRSAECRRQVLRRGYLDIPEALHSTLRSLADGAV